MKRCRTQCQCAHSVKCSVQHNDHFLLLLWTWCGNGGQTANVWWPSWSPAHTKWCAASQHKAASLQTEAWWCRQLNVCPRNSLWQRIIHASSFSTLDLNRLHINNSSCYICLFLLAWWMNHGKAPETERRTFYHMTDGHLLSKGQHEGGDWRISLSSVSLFHRRYYKYKQVSH